MKYIIDIKPIEGTNLFKAEGFKTLVFDGEGISKLTPLESELKEGAIIKTPNGSVLYTFMGFAEDGTLNCINRNNGKYVSLGSEKYVVVG